MEMFGMIELLMAVLVGGSGNDMLDYMQPQAYWQGKGVAVTAPAMQAELKSASKETVAGLIADLTGKDAAKQTDAAGKLASMGPAARPQLEKAAAAARGDPETARAIQDLIGKLHRSGHSGAVRRLMAIRTLGELKARGALPVLKGLLRSKVLFEAEYAAAAIMAIEGKTCKRPGARPKAIVGDLWRLPANSGIAGQFRMAPGKPMDIAKLVKSVAAMPDGMTADQLIKQGTAMLVTAVEMTGNIRLDSVTIGVSAEIGDRTGFVAIFVRGKYNSKAISAMMSGMGVKSDTVNGYKVLRPDHEVALLMPSDELLVFCAGPARDFLPIDDLTKAIKTGAGGFRSDSDLGKLIKTVDTTQPLWVAATITDAYRQALSLIAPFKTMTLVGKPVKDGQVVTLRGKGSDAAAVKAAADEFNGHITAAGTRGEQMMQHGGPHVDMMKPMFDFLKKLKAETKGSSASITVTFEKAASMLGPILMMVPRVAVIK
jgi:hypothetical protein